MVADTILDWLVHNAYQIDDDETIKSELKLEVIGRTPDVRKYLEKYQMFVGIGDNSGMEKLQTSFKSLGADIPILIHPAVVVREEVISAAGKAVMDGAVINYCSTIGESRVVNTAATRDHGNQIIRLVQRPNLSRRLHCKEPEISCPIHSRQSRGDKGRKYGSYK